MPDTRYPVSGSIRAWWVPLNGLANYQAPTVAELTAALDISDAISWNDKDFGIQTSNTTSDPAITAKGNTANRGAAQYGGSLSFYHPRLANDNSNLYSLVWDQLRLPGTAGYIVTRVDGLELGQTAGTTAQPGTSPAAGDLVTVYRVESAGYTDAMTGEDAFRWTVSFLPKGQVKTTAIVRASAALVPPVIVGTGAGAVGAKVALNATLISRNYTRGVRWTSSNQAFATVSANGIVSAIAAGTTQITATDKATGSTSTTFPFVVS